MKWNTKFINKFPCTIPIIGAPMAGVAGGKLAYEVCTAGGLGFIGCGYLIDTSSDTNGILLSFDKTITEQIQLFHELCSKNNQQYPLCLGFLSFGLFHKNDIQRWNMFHKFLIEHKPDVIQFFAPAIVQYPSEGIIPPTTSNDNDITTCTTKTNISFVKEILPDCLIIGQVGTVIDAIAAAEAGCDCLIVQGCEAGGHGLRNGYNSSTMPLVLNVISALCQHENECFHNIPIIAAGGIVNGCSMASYLLAGCDGIVLGTRLWMTNDSLGDVRKKQAITNTESCDNTIRTTVFDTIINSYSSIAWPIPFDSVGAVQNITTNQWNTRTTKLETILNNSTNNSTNIDDDGNNNNNTILKNDIITEYRTAATECDISKVCLLSGEGIGLITTFDDTAYNVVTTIEQDAQHILLTKPKLLLS